VGEGAYLSQTQGWRLQLKQNYDYSFELVVGHEGGYTKDSRDRGNWTSGVIGKGELKGTKYGISAMTYPHLDIINLTVDQAKAIYKKDFWDACRCDELPAGIDYVVFDAAINHGPARAIQLIQAAVGASIDGVLGPNTLGKIAAADPVKALTEFGVKRVMLYAGISTFKAYGLGWVRRAFETTLKAVAMTAPPTVDQSKEEPVDERQGSFLSKLFRST
jgi:lysozyme family protein